MTELDSIISYITKNYWGAEKIVEAGVGKFTYVIEELHNRIPDCKLIVTDLEKPPELPSGVKFKRDNITKPNLKIYENADLIYSIRTPQELLSFLIKISEEIDSDLLIKPVSTEEAPEGGNLINYEGASFYLFKPKKK